MAYPNSNDYANMDFTNWRGPSVNNVNGGASPASLFSGLQGLFAGDSLFSGNSLFGGTNANGTQSMGWAAPAIGIGQAVLGGINGNKQLGLAESQFKEGKRQFDLNYGAQRQTTNTQLEDRQRARVASNPSGYESVSSYLDKNRIK